MEILKYFVIIFSTGLILPLILNLIMEHNKKIEKIKQDNFIICYPRWLIWSLIGFCLLYFIIIIMANVTAVVEIYINILFVSFEVILLFFSLLLIRNRLEYTKGKIVYYPLFKKKKEFKLSDIEDVRTIKLSNGTIEYKMYKNNKKILSLNNSLAYVETFMKLLSEEKTGLLSKKNKNLVVENEDSAD